MAQKLRFNKVTAYRDKLDSNQEKIIKKLYTDMANDIKKELKALEGKTNTSSLMKSSYLKGLQKELNTIMSSNGKTLNKIIEGSMEKIAEYTIKAHKDYMSSLGMTFGAKVFNIPKDIVQTVATGKLYEGNWSLSSSIWKDVSKKQSDINVIIAKGIAENKSSLDIAKSLEMYVDPTAKKPWDWAKVYPGVHKQIDYNAQRLARTCVSHAYEEAFIRATEPNPFVLKYQWQASSAHPCPLCMDRNGEIYNKGSLPLDHPNGKCTFIAITEDEDKMIDRIANWANGGSDKELDDFSNSLGYIPQKTQSKPSTTNTSVPFNKEQWDKMYKDNSPKDVFNSFGSWRNSLTDNEARGIGTYSRQAYKDINKYLRGIGNNVGAYEKEMIEEATKALNKAGMPMDIVTRRAVSKDGAKHLLGADTISDIGKNPSKYIGKTVTEKGFTSTSLVDLDKFKGDVEYVIKIPKGSKAAYIGSDVAFGDGALGNSTEFEVLINKGAKFKVEHIETTSRGSVKKIYLTLCG